MQIATGTVSHRSIENATKHVIKDVIENINGTPDFLIVAFTPNYNEKQKYEEALSRICEESGTQNIIGGTFPGVATSNSSPTIQGCAVMAIKTDEMEVQSPFAYSNVRIKPNKGAERIQEAYDNAKEASKTGFFLTTGPFFQQDAFEQMKTLDTVFALKFKKIFNSIGRLINKNMGKNGYGTTTFADSILRRLAEKGVKNLIGGATIDLDMKSCFQFAGDKVFRNALVGTVFSSDKLHFGHGWAFDKSQRNKNYSFTDYLKSSGYIQKINKEPANEAFLDLIGIPRDLYDEAFSKLSYASLLYLSAIKSEKEDYVPFVSVCHPILDGVVSTIPESVFENSNTKADFFTQSGTGIQRSAFECAKEVAKELSNIRFGVFVNCSNRLLIAGDKIDKENAMIKEAIGREIPFITLYSGGEFSLINSRPIYSAVSVHGMVAGELKSSVKNVVF
jgi:hypothetical protein